MPATAPAAEAESAATAIAPEGVGAGLGATEAAAVVEADAEAASSSEKAASEVGATLPAVAAAHLEDCSVAAADVDGRGLGSVSSDSEHPARHEPA